MAKRPILITDVDYRNLVLGSTLTHQERSTLLFLKHSMYPDTLKIINSYAQIAKHLGLSRRQTINRIRVLEDLDLLVKLREGGGRYESGHGRCNVWQLNLELLGDFALPPEPRYVKPPSTAALPPKGEAGCTPKGEPDRRTGCDGPHPQVKPVAHNPSRPTSPRSLANNPPAFAAGGTQGKGADSGRQAEPSEQERPRQILPKMPRFASETQSRDDRLAQLRAQAALVEKRTGDSPTEPVQLTSEGGN